MRTPIGSRSSTRAGVALNLIAVGAAGWAKLAFPLRLLLGASVDPAFPHNVRARPFVRVVVARSRSAADQRARDFAEGVALVPAEFDGLGREALRRLASQRVERARTDRNDIGRTVGAGWRRT